MRYWILLPIIGIVVFLVCFFVIGYTINTGDDKLQKIQWSCMWGGKGYGTLDGPTSYSDGTYTIDNIICKWMPNEDYAKYYDRTDKPPVMNQVFQ